MVAFILRELGIRRGDRGGFHLFYERDIQRFIILFCRMLVQVCGMLLDFRDDLH